MPNTLTFDLDLSGQSPYNQISAEAVSLSGSRTYRSFAPKYAPYFYDSIVVRDAHTQRVLVKDIEYQCQDLAQTATVNSGRDVYRSVVVLNTAVSNDILVDYQTIGGEYVQDYTGIQALVNNLLADTRPLGWPNVVGKPQTFDPTMHLHSLGDVTGFEYVISAMEMIRQAILGGDQIQSDAILRYIDERMVELTNMISSGSRDLSYSAMLTAQAAKNAADAVQGDVTLRQQELTQLSATLRELLKRVQSVEDRSALAHSELSYYLGTYPITYGNAASPVLTNQLPQAATTPIQYGGMFQTVMLDDDYYVLSNTGQTYMKVGNVSSDYYSNAAFKVKLQAYKEEGTGYLKLVLSLNVLDTRLANLTGVYCKSMTVKVQPFQFIRDDGTLGSVNAWYSDININNTRIDPTVSVLSYRVYPSATDTIVSTQNKASVAEDIRKYLLDARADYNVKGYGQVDNRSAILLNIPVGTEVVMSMRLAAVSVGDVQRQICVNFSHVGDITNAVIQNNALIETVAQANPRGNRPTCVAVNVT